MTEITQPERASFVLYRPEIRQTTLTLLVATYIMVGLNTGFWERVFAVFPQSPLQQILFGFSIWALTLFTLELLGPWRLQKPVAAILILLAAGAQYYERNFGVLIDREMVRNVFETTVTESRHLITGDAVFQVALTGVLPAALVFWPRVRHLRPLHQLWRWPVGALVCAALLLGGLFSDFKSFSAVFREHKDLMGSYQPGATVTAIIRYGREQWSSGDPVVAQIGEDARPGPVLAAASDKPVLLVLFAGETARAQNFGLNGYARDTTPGLHARNVINFPNTTSCGTSTAVSLPCMFSRLSQAEYSRAAFLAEENLTDVLTHAGLDVAWYDNNTGDQRIMTRLGWDRVDETLDPDACAQECTDDIFLPLIQSRLDTITRNTVLILHMIGSHGPAYYLRYPQERALFQPECRTSQFANCEIAEIVNAYDNSILQTDAVLSRTIDMLAETDRVRSAMIYMSDHGESLGEDGLYLHAAPGFMAPEVQTRVPFLMWMNDDFRDAMAMDAACLRDVAAGPASQDNLFHSVLGLLDIQTEARDAALDLFGTCRTQRTN